MLTQSVLARLGPEPSAQFSIRHKFLNSGGHGRDVAGWRQKPVTAVSDDFSDLAGI